jgi:hypothetical protein
MLDTAAHPAGRDYLDHHPPPTGLAEPWRFQPQSLHALDMPDLGHGLTAVTAEEVSMLAHRAAFSALIGIESSASRARSSFGSRPSVVR